MHTRKCSRQPVGPSQGKEGEGRPRARSSGGPPLPPSPPPQPPAGPSVWGRGPAGQSHPPGTPCASQRKANKLRAEPREAGPRGWGRGYPGGGGLPAGAGETKGPRPAQRWEQMRAQVPRLRHLQIEDQVVEAFLRDAVVETHCGDGRGRERGKQPGAYPRLPARLRPIQSHGQ